MMHFVFFVRSAVVALLDLGLLSSTDLKSVTRAWQVADTIGILNSSFSVDRAGAETITIHRLVCCSFSQNKWREHTRDLDRRMAFPKQGIR